MKLLSTLFFLIASCGTAQPMPKMSVPSELKDDVKEFMVDCNYVLGYAKCNPSLDIKIKIKPLKEQRLGTCYLYSGALQYKRVIVISEDIVGTEYQKIVMYHELIHCLLHQEHMDDEIDIMNTYMTRKNTMYMYKSWDYFVTKALLRSQ